MKNTCILFFIFILCTAPTYYTTINAQDSSKHTQKAVVKNWEPIAKKVLTDATLGSITGIIMGISCSYIEQILLQKNEQLKPLLLQYSPQYGDIPVYVFRHFYWCASWPLCILVRRYVVKKINKKIKKNKQAPIHSLTNSTAYLTAWATYIYSKNY